jgi:hypothetical protein
MTDYTLWLNNSDQTRDNEVFAGLYAELRRIARSKMAGERQGGTLDTCGLLVSVRRARMGSAVAHF